jgi:hypothetical protein
MMEHVIELLGKFRPIWGGIFILITLVSGTTSAWTSAHLFSVNVQVDVVPEGPSTITTDVRFVVEGGYFHGFDMVNLPGAELDKSAGVAILDDKRALPVIYQRIHRDGRVRMLLDDDRYVRRGGITFRFVHKSDLLATGAIRPFQGRARLDWTPLEWEVGLDSMAITVNLPGESGDGPIQMDTAVAKDYVVETGRKSVNAIKYRPVKWYPMQIAMDFDAALIPGLSAMDKAEPQTPEETAAISGQPQSPEKSVAPLLKGGLLLLLVTLLGFSALLMKARHVRCAVAACGLTARFMLLSHTPLLHRVVLALLALLTGLAVQWAGYLTAGIPAVVTAAALLIFKREDIAVRPLPGGTWREMGEADIAGFEEKLSMYRRNRSSFFDIAVLKGVIGFTLFSAGVVFAAVEMPKARSDMMWAVIINGAVLAIPTWFSSIRAELPVNPTLEGFAILRKWRKSHRKLLGNPTLGGDAQFFIREDVDGPIEVRLRVDPVVSGLNNIEIAGEVYRTGTLYRTRTVFVFRLEPASLLTRKLAKCPGASEHHLTPDLQEEIIVLRNRRGRVSKLAPLRAALALIHG